MICYAGHGRSENRAAFVGKSLALARPIGWFGRRIRQWWPLVLPGRVLTGSGEVRNIFPHLDETQFN